MLHTLLANCIKAFAVCCLSPCVCASIKSRELQHVEAAPDIIYPGSRDARIQKPGECDSGICLSPPARDPQTYRKFIKSSSLFSLPIMKLILFCSLPKLKPDGSYEKWKGGERKWQRHSNIWDIFPGLQLRRHSMKSVTTLKHGGHGVCAPMHGPVSLNTMTCTHPVCQHDFVSNVYI